MIVDTLRQHLNTHMGKGTHIPSPSTIKEALEAFELALTGVYSQNVTRFPRPSNLGHEARRLWLMKNKPEDEGKFNLGVFTAMAGHVWEAVIIYLMKEAGLEIRNVQAKARTKMGGFDIEGSIDFEIFIEGKGWVIVDFKTCSDYAYKTKWQSAATLVQNDSYGYIQQAAVYEEGRNLPFGGWLVLNKAGQDTNGDISQMLRFVDADDIRAIIDEEKKLIAKRLKKAKGKEMPPQCYHVEQESYEPRDPNGPKAEEARQKGWIEVEHGKFLTNNIKVANKCAQCPHVKKTCFPDAYEAVNRFAKTFYINKPVSLKDGYNLVEEDNGDED